MNNAKLIARRNREYNERCQLRKWHERIEEYRAAHPDTYLGYDGALELVAIFHEHRRAQRERNRARTQLDT